MGGSTSNSANIAQNDFDLIYTSYVSGCSSVCETTTSGDVVIIDDAHIGGTVNAINQTCSANSSCIMANMLTSNLTNIISSIADSSVTSQSDLFGDFAYNKDTNSININSAMNNYVTQITQSMCSSEVVMNNTNNLVMLGNGSTVQGDFNAINIGSTGANSSCTMTNVSKIIQYNNLTANSKQKSTSVGMFGMIFAVLVIGAVIIAIIAAIVISFGGLAAVMGGLKHQATTSQKATTPPTGAPTPGSSPTGSPPTGAQQKPAKPVKASGSSKGNPPPNVTGEPSVSLDAQLQSLEAQAAALGVA